VRKKARCNAIDWYDQLFEFIDCTLPDTRLTVITFNYDRSLEFRLARQLAFRRGILREEARRILSQHVEILHVYGCLAPLPDGTPKIDNFAPEYGVLAGWDVWFGRTLIKIINRAESDPSRRKLYERCQGALAEAEYTIVLGFGYDPTNCHVSGWVKSKISMYSARTGTQMLNPDRATSGADRSSTPDPAKRTATAFFSVQRPCIGLTKVFPQRSYTHASISPDGASLP
jgi:hypothetical protein